MTFRPRVLNYDQIRESAEEFLDEYHRDRTIPVPIEEIVEFDLSMRLIPVPGIKEDLKVDAFLTHDLEQIFVDEWVMLHAPARLRFSLAHEAAHYWLHDELYQHSVITSVSEWREVQESIGEEDYKWFEWQANAFAGLVLVPRAQLRTQFQEVRTKALSLGLTAGQLEHHPARHQIINGLGDRFKVSEQVMEIRLTKDGLLSTLTPYEFS